MSSIPWPLTVSLIFFLLAAVAIGTLGTRLTRLADILADRTGLGEAVIGAVLLGASTSLPGITASVTAAVDAHPVLALSNAFGGIAAQTVFLAVADLSYRRVNLEHAAASVPNMMQGALLIALLSILLLAMQGPPVSFLGIHPATPVLFIAYLVGIRLVYRSHERPMWRPRMTMATRIDTPEAEKTSAPATGTLWRRFALSAGAVVVAGWVLTRSAESLAGITGISDSLMGGLLVAITTSLPELVTSIAAVKQGSPTLAVGGVLGGNAFDTLFAAVADIGYRQGSIYQTATQNEISLLVLTILMTSVLLLGLLTRERRGIANIGFESVLLFVLYLLGIVFLVTG